MFKLFNKKEPYEAGIVKVNLSDIKILRCFKEKGNLPSDSKMRSKYAAYRRKPKSYGRGKNTCIVVNQDLVLQDGYITYLIFKMFDKKKIKVKVVKDC